MKILVCGGRNVTDERLVFDGLDTLVEELGIPSLVIQGYARGVDKLALRWAILRRIPHTGKTYRALWEEQGIAAGVTRNALMLSSEHPDYVVAFPGGPGTRNMVTQARECDVPLIFVRVENGDRIIDLPVSCGR